MPRSARKESGVGIYHVMMRGINRQAIFDDDEDCRRFVHILADLPFQHDDDGRLLPIRTCAVYAWCLMTNHFHLLVMEKDWKIAEVIKSLASSYVYYYNKKNERIGHLFQERFKSEPCNDMEQGSGGQELLYTIYSLTFAQTNRVSGLREAYTQYGVENCSLRQAVRRNIEKFPEDFLLKLKESEANDLISKGCHKM